MHFMCILCVVCVCVCVCVCVWHQAYDADYTRSGFKEGELANQCKHWRYTSGDEAVELMSFPAYPHPQEHAFLVYQNMIIDFRVASCNYRFHGGFLLLVSPLYLRVDWPQSLHLYGIGVPWTTCDTHTTNHCRSGTWQRSWNACRKSTVQRVGLPIPQVRSLLANVPVFTSGCAVDSLSAMEFFFILGISAPAPEKLSMSKHSPDTILLQWKAPVAGSSPLLGYRVYVNGIEEGMVRRRLLCTIRIDVCLRCSLYSVCVHISVQLQLPCTVTVSEGMFSARAGARSCRVEIETIPGSGSQ